MFKKALVLLLLGLVLVGCVSLLKNPELLPGSISSADSDDVSDLEVNTGPTGDSSGKGFNLNFGLGRNPQAVLAEAEAEQMRALIPGLIEEQHALNEQQRRVLEASLEDAIAAGRAEHQVREELTRLEHQVALWEVENQRKLDAEKLRAKRTRNTILALGGGLLALGVGVAAMIYFPSRAAKTTAHALFGPVLGRKGPNTIVSQSPWRVLLGERGSTSVFPDFNPGVTFEIPPEGEPKKIGEEDQTASMSAAAAKVGMLPGMAERAGRVLNSFRSDRSLPSGDEQQ